MSIFTDMIKWGTGRLKAIEETSEIPAAPHYSFQVGGTKNITEYTGSGDFVKIGTVTPKLRGTFRIAVYTTTFGGGSSTADEYTVELRKKDGTVVGTVTQNTTEIIVFRFSAMPFTVYEIYMKHSNAGCIYHKPTGISCYTNVCLCDAFMTIGGASDE